MDIDALSGGSIDTHALDCVPVVVYCLIGGGCHILVHIHDASDSGVYGVFKQQHKGRCTASTLRLGVVGTHAKLVGIITSDLQEGAISVCGARRCDLPEAEEEVLCATTITYVIGHHFTCAIEAEEVVSILSTVNCLVTRDFFRLIERQEL